MEWNFFYQITAASRTPDWGLPPPHPRPLCPLSSTEFVEPPPKKIPGYATVSILLQHHISKLSRYFWSAARSVQVLAPYKAMLQMYHFTSFFLKFKSNLLVKEFFFLLNAAFAMAILDKGEVEVTRRRGRRRKKLLDDLKDRRGYSHLKEEALDRTMWRNRFGGGFGPVVRQNTEWMKCPLST